MSLYLINIGLIVSVFISVSVVHKVMRNRRDRALWHHQVWVKRLPNENDHDYNWRYAAQLYTYLRRAGWTALVTRFVNLATTLVSLIPIGFAIFNLITHHPNLALNFNLAAIAALIVTKGGLFLLTWILLPAAKAVPGAVTAAIITGKYNDWRKQREKKRPGG